MKCLLSMAMPTFIPIIGVKYLSVSKLKIKKSPAEIMPNSAFNDKAWEKADGAENWYQNFCVDRLLTTFHKEVRMTFNDKFVYVSFVDLTMIPQLLLTPFQKISTTLLMVTFPSFLTLYRARMTAFLRYRFGVQTGWDLCIENILYRLLPKINLIDNMNSKAWMVQWRSKKASDFI